MTEPNMSCETLADNVLEVRLNRPEKKNALTRAMYDGMAEAFRAAPTPILPSGR